MRKIIAIALATAAFAAFASCPPYAPYKCTQTMSGKVVCGCGL